MILRQKISIHFFTNNSDTCAACFGDCMSDVRESSLYGRCGCTEMDMRREHELRLADTTGTNGLRAVHISTGAASHSLVAKSHGSGRAYSPRSANITSNVPTRHNSRAHNWGLSYITAVTLSRSLSHPPPLTTSAFPPASLSVPLHLNPSSATLVPRHTHSHAHVHAHALTSHHVPISHHYRVAGPHPNCHCRGSAAPALPWHA